MPEGNDRDSGPSGRGGAIRVVDRGRRDSEDDSVSVLDLEGEGLAWRTPLDRNAERAAEERVRRINDCNHLDRVILAVLTPWGIKKIPRLTVSPGWFRNALAWIP